MELNPDNDTVCPNLTSTEFEASAGADSNSKPDSLFTFVYV